MTDFWRRYRLSSTQLHGLAGATHASRRILELLSHMSTFSAVAHGRCSSLLMHAPAAAQGYPSTSQLSELSAAPAVCPREIDKQTQLRMKLRTKRYTCQSRLCRQGSSSDPIAHFAGKLYMLAQVLLPERATKDTMTVRLFA